MTCILLLAASLAAVPADLPFDPETIVEQVTCRQGGVSLPFPPDTNEFMLDTVPLGTTRDPDPVGPPAVAWNGEDYLVVWKVPVYSNYPVYGARVSGQGLLLDSAGFCIDGSTGDSRTTCAVAWGGDAWLVVWTHSSYSIHGRFVSAGGVVQPGVITVADDAAAHYDPALAYDGTRFIAAWASRYGSGHPWDIRATPISTAGEVRYPNGLNVYPRRSWRHTNRGTAVAALPGYHLLVWESDQTGEWDIAGLVLDTAGVPLDTVPVLIAGEGEDATTAAVATDGTGFLVAWRSGLEALSDIHAARVSATGVVLDRPIAVCAHSHAQECPTVAFDGDNYLVAWHDWRNGNRDIYGARVSPTGQVLDPDGVRWTTAPQDETEPAVAAGDSSSLVVWQDWRWSNDADLFATRIGPDASVLDSAFPVPDTQDLTAVFAGQYLPDVAFDGENYLVVWEDHRTSADQWDIYGIRVSQDGGMLDSAPFPISSGPSAQQVPAVVFGGSTYLVVWQDTRLGNSDIYGTRVRPSGIVLDTSGIPIMTASTNQQTPALAFDGETFLAVYDNNGRVYATLIDTAGRVVEPSAISLTESSGAKSNPAVAYGDSVYLVVWEDWRYSTSWSIAYAMRFSPTRGILDSIDFRVSDYLGCLRPASAHSQQAFGVVWYGRLEPDVVAARVSVGGVPLDTAGVVLLSEAGSPSDVDVISQENRYVLALTKSNVAFGLRADMALGGADTFLLSRNPGSDRNSAIAGGPGRQALAVYACSTTAAGAKGARTYRIWGRFRQDDGTPLPPRILRPPAEYQFEQPPVVLLVDSTRDEVDSFEFLVHAWQPNGDTAWHVVAPVCSCAIPDSALENIRYYWQCRVRDTLGRWSSYTTSSKFWVLYLPVGVGVERGRGLPTLPSATVARRARALACAGTLPSQGLVLDVFGVDGRRVAEVRPGAAGALSWDWRDSAGRRVAAGIYIVRLTDGAGATAQRRYVLLD